MATAMLVYINKITGERIEIKVKKSSELREKFAELEKNKGLEIFAVNCSKAAPRPGGLVLESPNYWCPYCAHVRLFIYDSLRELWKCRVCHISWRDYFVRMENGLEYFPAGGGNSKEDD